VPVHKSIKNAIINHHINVKNCFLCHKKLLPTISIKYVQNFLSNSAVRQPEQQTEINAKTSLVDETKW